jgi:phosphoenolpyruvate carboxylase
MFAKDWHGAIENGLCVNDGRIPNTRGVRVHVSTGYNRVEGNRRATRNGRVNPKSLTFTISFFGIGVPVRQGSSTMVSRR